MTRRWSFRALAALLGAAMVIALPGLATPARAAEYTLTSTATYTVNASAREVDVHVQMSFTNTTPDPAGQFSLFDQIRVAVHDHARSVAAADGDGELDVSVDEEDGVNVATVDLREGLRYKESVDVDLDYVLRSGDDPTVRIGPSLVVFPAWGFGTRGEVQVEIPASFEVRVDGDPLTEAGAGVLSSGPIQDPGAWLAVVTAVGAAELVDFAATVPLDGGTADVLVRAFADDPDWGEATRDLVVSALPLIEEEVGMPYPLLSRLVITQGVPGDSSGFGEGDSGRADIVVAFDQPPFTVLHQLVHVWLPATLVDSRWIAEGYASDIAARVAADLDVDLPYDPAAEADARVDDAFALDAWPDSDPAANAFGYAASWALVTRIRDDQGADALRLVLQRTAASIGAYDGASVDLPIKSGGPPREPLGSRTFLDQLETVTGAVPDDSFAERVFDEADAALLPARRESRTAFDALVEAATGWGAPDPVRAAMSGWRFDDAGPQITAARVWLTDRDGLLDEMEAVGLSAPDRLQQAYRAYGGGPEAVSELAAQRGVVEAYAAAADRVNGPRSFLTRLGLIGSTDPTAHLSMAAGRFAGGDLRGALDSIADAERVLSAAETGGLVRVISLVLLVVALAAVAVAVFRRRASYTARQ